MKEIPIDKNVDYSQPYIRKDICIDEPAAISEETFNKVDNLDLIAKLFDGTGGEDK